MLGLDEVVDGIFGRSPLGLGLIAVAAVVAVAGPRAKPLAKDLIKGYLATTDRAREWVAEASEQIQDLYAEARHEYESELSGAAVADQTAEAAPTEHPTPATPAPPAAPAASAAPAEPRPRRRGGSTASSGIVLPSGEPA